MRRQVLAYLADCLINVCEIFVVIRAVEDFLNADYVFVPVGLVSLVALFLLSRRLDDLIGQERSQKPVA